MMNGDEENKISMNRALLLTLLAVSFALGIFSGSLMDILTSPSAGKGGAFPGGAEGTFKFIRASAADNAENNRTTRELRPFQYKVSESIERTLQRGDASAVSVYFRDLNNGNWFGIGERDKFIPKGLLKVPLMIAYFKWAESNPLVLRKALTYTGDEKRRDERELGSQANKLEPGATYSVNDLIFRMIAYDDAAASALLRAHLPPGRLEKIYSDLSVDYNPRKQDEFLSLKALASFYRVLYNASYLSEEMSEKALRYLSKAVSASGMAAVIPSNIDLAAKRGELTVSLEAGREQRELRQLHEFGIIYHPHRPFILGVMARGTDADRLAKALRDITSLVYEEVDRQS